MGEIVTNPDPQPISVSTAWTPLLDRDTMSFFGMNKVTLTNWDAGTLLPEIAQGSAIDIDGSVARFITVEAIGGAPANGTVYVKFIVTGDTVTAELTATAPVWDNTKGGWYNGSGERYSGHLMTKNGTAYTEKKQLSDGGYFASVGPAGIGLEVVLSPGENIVMHDDNATSDQSDTPVLEKTFTITSPGTYRASWNMKRGNVTTGTAYSAIYKNGAQVGPTESSVSNTDAAYSYDLALAIGDTCELWIWAVGTGTNCTVSLYKLKIADTLSTFTKQVLGFDL